MNIRRIRGKNIKGSSFEAVLAKLNYITGRNSAGKSTRADALTLALSGFHPGKGKPMRTNADVMELASGDEMTVSAEFSDGRSVLRTWRRGRSGSVSKEVTVSGFAVDWTAPAIMFDVSGYLALSDAARVDYVFGLCGGDDFRVTPESLAAKFKGIKVEPMTEEAEVIVGELAAQVYESHDAGQSSRDFLADVEERLASRLSLARQSVKRMNLTAQGLEQLRTEAAAAAPDQGAEAKLAAATQLTARLRAEKSQVELDGVKAKGAKARLDEIQAELGRLDTGEERRRRSQRDADRAKVAGWTPEGPRLRHKLATLEEVDLPKADAAAQRADAAVAEARRVDARIGALKASVSCRPEAFRAVQEAVEKRARLDQELRNYNSARPGALRMLNALRAEASGIEAAKGEAEASMKKLQVALEATASADHCPMCLASAEGWRDAVVKTMSDNIKDHAQRIAALDRQLECARQRVSNASGELEAADRDDDAIQVKRTDAAMAASGQKLAEDALALVDGQIEELRKLGAGPAAAWLDRSLKEATDAVKAVEASIAETEKGIESAAAADAERQAVVDRVVENEKWLWSYDATASKGAALRAEAEQITATAESHQALKDKWAVLDESIRQAAVDERDAHEQYKKWVASKQQQSSKRDALKSALRAQADAEVTAAACDILAEERSKLVASAFGKILAAANRLAAPILDQPLAYLDGVIGKVAKGQFHGLRTFSGSETAVACAALALALASDAPVKLVMIDEVDVDADRKARLTDLLFDLVAKGDIDQVVLIGTGEPLQASRWNVIEVQ